MTDKIRVAYLREDGDPDQLERVLAYLPDNYTARWLFDGRAPHGWSITIVGTDKAGWTLDGYVLPRLASGLMFAEEGGI